MYVLWTGCCTFLILCVFHVYVHFVDGIVGYSNFMSRLWFMDRKIGWEDEQEGEINVVFRCGGP